ncbi:unnamed protein product [Thlaspi arvense]|uniref:MPN domain-containing protein n=1 Tax=Thlaspi arvense TaxID=13288 RepID=A0AAU9RHY3_THLAR|nr:unnamed protein product [Thlaspi arvense]
MGGEAKVKSNFTNIKNYFLIIEKLRIYRKSIPTSKASRSWTLSLFYKLGSEAQYWDIGRWCQWQFFSGQEERVFVDLRLAFLLTKKLNTDLKEVVRDGKITENVRRCRRALGHPPPDSPTLDSSEQVYISSLALLKMLKHGRAGVPMEVMGLMLGEFVDEYTVRVVDVFAMPQSGTGVSVEAVDHVFQTNMLDMLKQTGRGGVCAVMLEEGLTA